MGTGTRHEAARTTAPLATLLAAGVAAAALLAAPGPGFATDRSLAGPLAARPCPSLVGGLDLTRATIPELRSALDAGQLTSRQLVDGYLARIEALNRRGPKLRPVIRTSRTARAEADAADAARAAGEPGGPLAGIPVLIKDNIDTHSFPTTAGAKAMRGAPPPKDAFLVDRWREAGAIVLGKANLDEWATAIDKRQPKGFSDVGGQTLNPYTLGSPQGSSGGPAVSAASGLAASTVGTETYGSIIAPSFVNSAVGIKPTRGLISRGGVIPLLNQFDTPGPIDQNVTDAAYMLGLMTGIDPRDKATRAQRGHVPPDYTAFLDTDALEGARIGVPKIDGSDEILRIPGLAGIRAALEAQGATVVDLDADLLAPVIDTEAFLAQFRRQLNRYLRDRGKTSPEHSLKAIVRFNRKRGKRAVKYGQRYLVDAEKASRRARRLSYAKINDTQEDARRTLDAAFSGHNLDAIIASLGTSAITNTAAGWPSITVPAGYQGAAPYGLILTGKPWSEGQLIGYAFDFERATQAWRSPTELNPKFAAACPG